MAFHCGAPTRDGSPCQRHVREPGTRCPQHRNLGGPALHPPRHAMRTIHLADPTLITAPTPWTIARADLTARAGELRDRVTQPPNEASDTTEAGTLADEERMTRDEQAEPQPASPIGSRSYLDRERSRRRRPARGEVAEAGGAMRDGETASGSEKAAAEAEPDQAATAPTATSKPAADMQPKRVTEAEQADAAVAEPDQAQTEPSADTQPNGVAEEAEQADAVVAEPDQAQTAPAADTQPNRVAEAEQADAAVAEPDQAQTEPSADTQPNREAAPEPQAVIEPAHPASFAEAAALFGRKSYLERERASRRAQEADAAGRVKGREAERPVEQRPMLRKERALDPDWIGARPLFRDEAPTRPAPRIEFEPSEPDAPRKPPRISAMRSVVLNPQVDAEPDADPPTLIDRIPPIDPDDLAVPDFLRPDFVPPAPEQRPEPPAPAARQPLPQRQRRTRPATTAAPAPKARTEPQPQRQPQPQPQPEADPPTLIDPHPPIAPEEISVPDFMIPGFSRPAQEPPLRTVLSTVLGPDLWHRCYTEWTPAHCTALARIARAVDGLAPSAGAAVRSTAGAGMRWLGVAREREMLADEVADAISHPVGATAANKARTVRLYGAAICVALHVPLRRCACHRDLERDVSGELIRLGLEELAGEVP